MEQIGIIGLGYVGASLLERASGQDLPVVGYDTEPTATQPYEEASDDPDVLKDCGIYMITVPTPLKGKEPDYRCVKEAVRTAREYMAAGDTLILESTVAPGTCQKIVRPLLEEDGFIVGEDVFLAFCPERVDPGNEDWDVSNIPRVLGSMSPEGMKIAHGFYDKILDAEIYRAPSIEIAEASKIAENAFRDINIAFVNELAKICDQIGIDVRAVLEAASTKPFGFTAYDPGCGVGGHCIPVDPYYLITESEEHGHTPALLSTAREINDSMPQYTVEQTMLGLNQQQQSINGSTIALLGLAYKGGVSDTRMSPGQTIKERLEELGGDVVTIDPHIKEADQSHIDEVDDPDCIIIATDHEEFLDWDLTDRTDVIIDGRNLLDDPEGVIYRGIGI